MLRGKVQDSCRLRADRASNKGESLAGDVCGHHASARTGLRRQMAALLMLLFCVLPLTTRAQAIRESTSTLRNRTATFVTLGGGNTQFPRYADNAVGMNFGLFYQRNIFVGAEVRGGTYPASARYSQSPVTAGYRVGMHSQEGEDELGWSPFSLRHAVPFAYIGGGGSHAQDSGTDAHNPPLAAKWEPCWQVSFGLDRSYRFATWRMFEISYTKTYADLHDVRTAYASTGIVFHFKH